MSTSSTEPWTGSRPVPRSRFAEPPRKVAFVVLLLVIIGFGLVRYRLREMPLERDEGEYAYSGQLLLEEIPAYKLAYNMKLPGIYAAYAGVMALFGETPAGIHEGLLLINAATILVLYLVTVRLFGRLAALVAASSYAALSTSSSVLGFQAHATNFVVLPALAGILLALIAADSANSSLIFLSGIFSGIAFLMKQHGIFFVLFCLLYLWYRAWKRDRSSLAIARTISIFTSGAILPYGITCLLLYRAGVFRTFWFWTVSYAGEYSKIGLRRSIHAFLENSAQVTAPAAPVWILAALGLSTLWWCPDASKYRFFVLSLFLFSFASVCPGAYFRPHYFVLLLPAVAMLAGVAIDSSAKRLAETEGRRFAVVPIMVFAAAFSWAIVSQRQNYCFLRPEAVFQLTYPNAPFLAAKNVAEYVRDHSSPGERIAVLGSEPEIYFYAQRHSATGYIYMYSLVGHQKYLSRMQDQMLQELRESRPKCVVYVDVWDSWGDRGRATESASFLKSLNELVASEYERVGVADLGPLTEYVWGDAAKSYVVRSTQAIYVLRRKIDGRAGVF